MAPACRDGGQDSDGLLLLQAPMKSHPPDRWAPARAPSPADRSPVRHEVSQKPSQTGLGTLHLIITARTKTGGGKAGIVTAGEIRPARMPPR
jgi:hypothetical protein